MAKHLENDSFFDAPEEISSETDDESDSEPCSSELQQVGNNVLDDFWSSNVKSINERRDAFIRKTGFELDRCHTAREGPDDTSGINTVMSNTTGISTVMSNYRTKGANKIDKGDSLGCQHYVSDYGEDDQSGSGSFQCSSSGRESDDSRVDNTEMKFRKLTARDEYRQKSSGSSDRELMGNRKHQFKEGWFKRLSFKASNMFNKDKEKEKEKEKEKKKEIKEMFHHHEVLGSKTQRIRVSSHNKWGKELSSLYRKQEFSGHRGSILTMKFSFGGNYLATGGEDGTLNVWKVVEDENVTDFDLLSLNAVSTSLNFSVDGISNMAYFLKFKEGNVMNKLKNPSDSAVNGIMIPRKVFRILEDPLHEFHGHEGEILDISWSKSEHLISASVDKTVRLWKVGHSRSLRVFPHNDFVTCAQFNPVDGDYFITGSIDGIVRIWDVLRCQVVDWIDFKEIVTAICYRPDGKGGIAGSMAGNCSFFEIADESKNRHASVIYVQGKKMLSGKRITGFQFSPSNPSEVVISSADNLVRIIKGADIICKLRGPLPIIDRGSQAFASFTADGKHIISATDDSDVYVWNHVNEVKIPNGKHKNIWSSESFFSQNALIAVPWRGITSNSELTSTARQHSTPRRIQGSPDLSDYYSGQEELSEDLQRSSPVLPVRTGENYEFLRNVYQSIMNGSHMWGLVIVTGGKDGIIRTYRNYGLPVRYPTGKSLRSTLSFSNLRNRCKDNRSNLKGSTSMER